MLKFFNFNSIILLSASPFLLIVFFHFISSTTSGQLIDICSSLTFNCGQGTCKASASAIVGFECECFAGWRNIQIGPFTWPSCVLPNCSLDFKCGSLAPILSPSPAPALPPLIPDLSSPCGPVWCGDGNCLANGTGHTCQCFKGAENLLSLPEFPCFRPCYLGSDCIGLSFDDPPKTPLQPPPSPPYQPPPPGDYVGLQPPLPSSPTFNNNSSQTSNCSKNIRRFMTRIIVEVVVAVATLLMLV